MAKPKITAANIKEFEQIESEINKLHSAISSNIEYAEKKFSYIHCKMNSNYNQTISINLPKDLSSIEVSKTEVVAYSEKFRFEQQKKEEQTFKVSLI